MGQIMVVQVTRTHFPPFVTMANLLPLSQEYVSGLYLSQMTPVAFSSSALYDTVYSHLLINPCVFLMFSIFHDFRP